MSALFNFSSLMRTLVLLVCTSTYIKIHFPILTNNNNKISKIINLSNTIGERLSIYVSMVCLYFGLLELKSLLY